MGSLADHWGYQMRGGTANYFPHLHETHHSATDQAAVERNVRLRFVVLCTLWLQGKSTCVCLTIGSLVNHVSPKEDISEFITWKVNGNAAPVWEVHCAHPLIADQHLVVPETNRERLVSAHLVVSCPGPGVPKIACKKIPLSLSRSLALSLSLARSLALSLSLFFSLSFFLSPSLALSLSLTHIFSLSINHSGSRACDCARTGACFGNWFWVRGVLEVEGRDRRMVTHLLHPKLCSPSLT